MLKRLVPFLIVVFAFSFVGNAFADNEDDIISNYLQKKEIKVKKKIGFVSGRFQYGKLPEQSGYGLVNFTASTDLTTISGTIIPHEGIYRSKEIGLQFGMMIRPQISLQVGFDYWLTMGTVTTVDYTTTIGVLSVDDDFQRKSDVNVYGISFASDYYLLDHPDNYGILNSLAIKIGAGAGWYMANWDYWIADDEATEPLKSNSPALWAQVGFEYPTPLFNMVMGFSASYFYLNLTDFSSYNSEGGDLQLTKFISGDPLELDFSGPRAQFELKRYFSF